MLENDIAYCAGLFDGEGCIIIRRHKTSLDRSDLYSLMITLTNTNHIAVDTMMSVFDCGSIMKHIRIPPSRDCYVWQCYGRNAFIVLSILKPYIKLKSKQIEVIEEFMKIPKTRGQHRTPFDVTEKRQYLKDTLSELNIHGDIGK